MEFPQSFTGYLEALLMMVFVCRGLMEPLLQCEVLSGASLLLIRAAGARGETTTKQRNPLRENVDG